MLKEAKFNYDMPIPKCEQFVSTVYLYWNEKLARNINNLIFLNAFLLLVRKEANYKRAKVPDVKGSRGSGSRATARLATLLGGARGTTRRGSWDNNSPGLTSTCFLLFPFSPFSFYLLERGIDFY